MFQVNNPSSGTSQSSVPLKNTKTRNDAHKLHPNKETGSNELQSYFMFLINVQKMLSWRNLLNCAFLISV